MQRMKYGLVCSSMSMSDSSECWDGRGGEGRGRRGRGEVTYIRLCLLIFTHLP